MEEKIFQYPNISETAFSINLLGLNLNVQWYGLSYIAGILLAWYFMAKLVKNKDLWFAGHSIIERSEVDDLITYMILGIIIGGRLGYCLFYAPGYYFENPIRVIYVWEGGMSFHGGFLGVIMSGALFGVRKKINLLSLGDLIAFASPPGLFFGRIANFINTELYGRVTDFPFAIIYPSIDYNPRHPSQLYEALFEGIILFIILIIYFNRNRKRYIIGNISGLFLIFYSLFRFLIEFLREPDYQLGLLYIYFSMGQLLSIPLFIAGLFIFFRK